MEDGFGVAGLNCLKLTDKSRQVRLFPLSLIPIRYFSFCDTGFLIKIPDSQHLFRKYRNFSVKFQQMYSLFHGVLFLTIIFNLAWNV